MNTISTPPANANASGRLRRRLWVSGVALSCIVFAVIAINVRDFLAGADHRVTLGHDLLPSYVAGDLVRTGSARLLYDSETIRAAENRVRADANMAPPTGSGGARGFGPWLNPPFFAWVFVPLSALPYNVAALLFLLLNVLLLAGALALLGRFVSIPIERAGDSVALPRAGPRVRSVSQLKIRARRWNLVRDTAPSWPRWGLVPLFLLTCMPFWQAICHQQNTFISLALLCLAVTLWRQTRGFAAGCCIGLLFFKPQLAAAVALVLALDLGWTAVAGLLLVGSSLLLTNLLTLPGTLGDYLHRLPPILHYLQNELAYNWGRQVTFQSFWRLIVQGQHPGETLSLSRTLWYSSSAIVGIALAATLLRCRRSIITRSTFARDQLISTTILAMPLLMPYYMDYDLLLLAIPATLFARQTVLRNGNARLLDHAMFWAWVAFFLETQINPGLAGEVGLNLAVPILFILFTCSATSCWIAQAQSVVTSDLLDTPRMAA